MKKAILVPVTLKPGFTVRMDANSIPHSAWNNHHGKTAAGVQVNSPSTIQVGETVLTKTAAGHISAMPADDFEVMATQFLQGKGLKIETPTQA
jgi:hypothetical protein